MTTSVARHAIATPTQKHDTDLVADARKLGDAVRTAPSPSPEPSGAIVKALADVFAVLVKHGLLDEA